VSDEETTIPPGIYEHFKGKRYEVFGVARHSETLELHVHYRTLYGEYDHWVRPASMFLDSVTVGGVSTPRFRRIEDPELD